MTDTVHTTSEASIYGVNKAPSAYAFPCVVPPGCSDGQTSPFGLTKREYFAVFATQPGVSEIVTAAGLSCPDNFTVWKDAETKLGTFNDWWSKLSNQERFALTSKVRVQQADALIEALSDDPRSQS